MQRTKDQKEANEVYIELFRCLVRAERQGWDRAAAKIRVARSDIRSRMHDADRLDSCPVASNTN